MRYSTIVSTNTNPINLKRIGQHLNPSIHIRADPKNEHSPISKSEKPTLRHVLSSSQLNSVNPTAATSPNSGQSANITPRIKVFSPRHTNP